MEAVALYEYNKQDNDELSFQQGDSLLILKIDDESDWYTAELNGIQGMIPSNYIEMKDCDWFNADVSRKEAEHFLMSMLDCSYLIRIGSEPNTFSLSVRNQAGVEHFKILRDSDGKFYLWNIKFPSLNKLIEYHKTQSVSRYCDLHLLYPVQKKNLVEALYDYHAQDSSELTIERGNVIVLLETEGDWWEGRIKNREGKFPATFVKRFD